ncbi:metal ABC transporter ATP-binding protein [Sporanaerobacter sp. PP17-6a]|uniref:metal ABC transporter ATP-binding protein n=1 Tax=Sporanaerobacter sp. PP17-6a TaxID=1891289 RepID=UPI0008DA203B|nr:metal ABC transporter ATP-binding protein [Sporanaerobacter sp. PP17-6a]
MDNIIEVNNLNFGYGEKFILKDVSFSVKRGDFLGIIGANGSGKSTLMKLMLKILAPLSGNIRMFGQNIEDIKSWNKISYISQKLNFFNSSFPTTVEEVVEANLFSQIGLFKRPKKCHKEMVYQILKKVGMEGYRKTLIGNLSGGELQRVFIAKALINNPEILFLDESTVGIDAKSEETVYSLLTDLNQNHGLTIILITHDIFQISHIANRIICLGKNGLLEQDLKNGMTEDILKEIYGQSLIDFKDKRWD